MRAGFTLLEVIVSLLLLEVAVLAATGTFVLAARSHAEAQHLERAVLDAEGVLDSLAGVPGAASGFRPYSGGVIEWTVGAAGDLELQVVSQVGDVILSVASAVEAP